jgi:hypothetical protein
MRIFHAISFCASRQPFQRTNARELGWNRAAPVRRQKGKIAGLSPHRAGTRSRHRTAPGALTPGGRRAWTPTLVEAYNSFLLESRYDIARFRQDG